IQNEPGMIDEPAHENRGEGGQISRRTEVGTPEEGEPCDQPEQEMDRAPDPSSAAELLEEETMRVGFVQTATRKEFFRDTCIAPEIFSNRLERRRGHSDAKLRVLFGRIQNPLS